MFYSSRKGLSSSSSRKQTSFTSKTTSNKHEDGNKSGNETDCGSTELLDISTSREDLSPSRCSCISGGSNVAVRNEARDGGNEHFWTGNLRLEFDNNGGSDDEQLKDELLRIFDRERLGLESYFKQKTENILAGYRRKQYEWEEKVRLERMEYEKTLAQEKIEVQQNYISEMTNLTKQFNQERMELECHYKKQIEELSQQFELRKNEMDGTIIKERTELKERLELEYQAMLKSQKAADEQRYHQQISELEESYKKKILELEQKLKDSFSEGELSGRRLQSELEAKFEHEKSLLVVEWRKRVELLEVELGKEKERVNKEERKASEAHGFLRKEISQKDFELEKLRKIVETLKLEVCHKEKTAKEYEMLQQNIFLRGSDALPGKLREDFEKMMAAHRAELEKNLRKEREGLESEREARFVLERETLKKQLNVERERMNLDLEKERSEMRQASRETEDRVREEVRQEMDRMRAAFESEKVLLRDTVIKEREEVLMMERKTREVEKAKEIKLLKGQIRTEIMKEKQDIFLEEKEVLTGQLRDEYEKQISNTDKQSKQQKNDGKYFMKEHDTREGFPGESEEEELDVEAIKSQRGRNFARPRVDESQLKDCPGVEGELWLANDRMQHTKQWVEKQYRITSDTNGYVEDSGDSGKNIDMDGNEAELEFLNNRHEAQHRGCNIDNRGGNNDKFGCGNYGKGLWKSQASAGKGETAAPPSKRGVDVCADDISEPRDKSNNPEYRKARNPDQITEYNVQGLKEENEGLKAKVGALQENIELHECFKKEASEEVQRLRTANKDLKMKLEELKDTTGDCEELKAILKNCKGKLKDNEAQLKNNEEKIREYEDICAEYERSLQKCRQRIMVIENNRAMSTDVRGRPGDAQKLSERALKGSKEAKYQGMMDDDDNSVHNGHAKTQDKHDGQMVINILENEKVRLEKVVKNLEEKIKLLELKISEITLIGQQADITSSEKTKLSSDLENVRRQNKGLVNKVKDVQCQLQAMVDKLKKKKKKITILRDQNQSLKFSYQREISELQRKLECSSLVIKSLERESSKESNHICHLQKEILKMSKMMIEERVCEQRMLKARSMDEIERLRDLDRDKLNVERKLNDARMAMDGYSERLKNKLCFTELMDSQVSLNTDTTLFRDQRVSKTLQALGESRRTSQHQNERIEHEKHELKTLLSRLCKLQEGNVNMNGLYNDEDSLTSSLSSTSSLSLVDPGRETGEESTKLSSNFSSFHWY